MGRREHLLEHVFGVLRRADHAPAIRQQPGLVAVEEGLEGPVVALAHEGDQALVRLHAARPRRSGPTRLTLGLVVRVAASITAFIGRTG